jgi:redox-sensitive bicupin YhaK (pirin superfamily)
MIPVVEKRGALLRVVAGAYAEISGPVTEIAASPLYMDVTLEPAAEIALQVPTGHTAVAYLFEGEGLFGLDETGQGEFVQATRMAVFSDGEAIHIQAGPGASCRFMLMTGAPFGEPIVPYGPFVMNTIEEIQQALDDLRSGRFVEN